MLMLMLIAWFKFSHPEKSINQSIHHLLLLFHSRSAAPTLPPLPSPSLPQQTPMSSSSSSSYSFLLPLNPPVSVHILKPRTLLQFQLPFPRPFPSSSSSSSSSSVSKSFLCFSSAFPPPSGSGSENGGGREEFLWLREEQRWLREEQRWLREEQRWMRERESLLRQIHSLELQIQALESRISVSSGDLPEIMALLQVLKEKNQIAENASGGKPIVLEEEEVVVVEEKKEVIRVLDHKVEKEEEEKEKMKRKTLRKGSEGEDVREMQEALQKLGFYSGEEDMEFSSFSSGTERAVKTWQASLGTLEDGIMTAELLERLYMSQQVQGIGGSIISTDRKESNLTVSTKEGANGAAVASVTEILETQKKVVKEDGVAEVEVSQQRVFLLGENRWEEPSRLVGRDKQVTKSKAKGANTKCLACRGEGRLMCTECDGSGEPNIEPQFLEWIDEDAKCPYCEGLGHIVCDVCEGKTVN